MENNINSLPIREVLLLMLIGGLLYFGLYLVTTYFIPVLKKKNRSIALYWNRIRVVLWTAYLLLAYSFLFRESMYLTIAISVISLVVGWNFWKNLFAGLAIKFSNQFKVNDHISTDLAEGKILAIKISFTEIINSKGELLVIPNRLLKNAVLRHINQKNKLNASTFLYNGKLSYNKLYEYAINCPFIIGNQSVKISRKNSDSYEIKAMLIDDSFEERTAAYFEKIA